MSLRFVFTKGIDLYKSAFIKECEKNDKKLNMKNVLNEQTHHQILEISKILRT